MKAAATYRIRAVVIAAGFIGLLLAILWFFTLKTTGERPGVTRSDALTDLVICASINKMKNPQGISEWFPADTRNLYCWAQIHRDEKYSRLTMVWRRNGVEINRQAIDTLFRTKPVAISQQRIERTGVWSCEVLSPDETLLGKAEATVR